MNKKLLIGGASVIVVVGLAVGAFCRAKYMVKHTLPVCGGVITEEDMPGAAASGNTNVEIVETQTIDGTDAKKIDLMSAYDLQDDLSLQNGMRTVVSDAETEEAFLSMFFAEGAESSAEVIEENNSKVYLGADGDEKTFVIFISQADTEYPKQAYGFKYKVDGAEVVGEEEFFDLINPLSVDQDKTYVKDDNGATVKVEYTTDPQENGTYNSSGEVFMNAKEMPLYRVYYVTDGSRVSYYLYDEQGKLEQCLDFGGMAFKGMEENPDIEIGVDCQIYLFS